MRRMASSTTTRGVAATVGVGPKLGRSITRESEGRKAQVFVIRIDCSDSKSISEAFDGFLSLEFVEVLVYNAYYQPVFWNLISFTDIKIDSFEKSLVVSFLGAFLCAQQVLPGMVKRRRGMILFTGRSTSLCGIAGFSELCCEKFVLRALPKCL
ncbi:hypothetical protein V6N11_082391 [Hibiscus sabdariffa]|uniref:Uncharacterized protein n=2 Tax=Hibiscus sabdariffa TaxID=183260 RepID=A0ABR2BTL3_9ROSI